jgi:two-component system sensor histidine kinase ChiS
VCRPFTRIEETGGHLFGGVGLGIPIARQVVELHGGHMEIESELNKGSTFTIVLPVSEEASK